MILKGERTWFVKYVENFPLSGCLNDLSKDRNLALYIIQVGMTKLFIVGIPRTMNEIELDLLFTREGMVKKLTIVRDKDTGISRGYGFVHMMDKYGAERAIESLNGYRIGDRIVSVRLARNRTPERSDPLESSGREVTIRKLVTMSGDERKARKRRPRRNSGSSRA